MTIRYTLTRFEILRTFLYVLPRSPRILGMTLLISALLGAMGMNLEKSVAGKGFTFHDAMIGVEWMIGAFCFFLFWVFLRAKTKERTLTVSERGVYTEIGPLKSDYPWTKIRDVRDVGQYLLIVNWTGNAFFIPSRAFTDITDRNQFIAEVARYRAGS